MSGSPIPPPPPDRSHILAEQRNPRSMNLHALSTRQVVDLINAEDRTVAGAVAAAGEAIAAFIDDIIPRFLRGGRLIYLGAGTSGRLGVLDASECPPTFQMPPGRIIGLIAGGDASLRRSSEGREDEPQGAAPELDALQLTPDDALLGIAAGGTTPYVLGALEHARSRAAPPRAALLVCSPVERPAFVDHFIVVATGPEVLTGSTRMKAGTATKLVLNTISTTLMVRTGRVFQNLMVDLRASNAKLRDRAARIIGTLTGLSREPSLTLLDAANGSVKAAVVMHHRRCGLAEAERLLASHDGRLETAVGG